MKKDERREKGEDAQNFDERQTRSAFDAIGTISEISAINQRFRSLIDLYFNVLFFIIFV